VAELMAGRLTIAGFRAVTIDPRRDGRINWSMNPFGEPTWFEDFRSGGWIEQLISGYEANGPHAAADRARAAAIITGWLRAVPLNARDPLALVCLSQAFPGQRWIDGRVARAVNYDAAHWLDAWNQGLKQDIGLLKIGCGYPATAFGGATRRWRSTAVRQLIASFEANPLGPELYASGVPERIGKLPAFLAHATEPNGDLTQLGDSYVERSAAPGPRGGLVAVYRTGYVFGRSSWSKDASFCSLRFGPGRELHGHDDHMGLTYYAGGRNLFVDSGNSGYAETGYRAFLRSPEASSDLVMPGVPFRENVPTVLVKDQVRRRGQFYELTLIVPAAPGTPVATTLKGPRFGPYRLSVRIGRARAAFVISARGTITGAAPGTATGR
jgi:hypothetical protein